MKNINVVTLCGRLVRDPELKVLSTGTSLSEISLAVSDDYKDTKKSYFFDCKVWGKGADALVKYSKKGDSIIINGHLTQERWEQDGKNKSKVIINILDFQFTGGKKEAQEQPETFPAHVEDSDVPF